MACIKRVVCAISGGVDSAVSALLLKSKGYEVIGLFMKNWDMRDEYGHCMSDSDRQDAQFVCDHIGIPLHDVNFVKEYWNKVFLYLLREYEAGHTPNPDVLCNKYIKFDKFINYARDKFNADAIATGHYARIGRLDTSDDVKLLRSVDVVKDQTLFLAQISQNALRKCIFPVGHLMKRDVKRLATDAGLERIVKKKESMGICFIGTRNFKTFIEKYLDPTPGLFIDIETNKAVGEHNGAHYYTVGQRSLLRGKATGYYVVNKDADSPNVTVAAGTHHPALYSGTFVIEQPHWIHRVPESFVQSGTLSCQFKFQHIDPLVDCNVRINSENNVTISRPLRALTTGQFAVFYRESECLGSARIIKVGPSLYELKRADELFMSNHIL